jgi:hypothetical protein
MLMEEWSCPMSHVVLLTVVNGELLKYQVRCDEGIVGIGRKTNSRV